MTQNRGAAAQQQPAPSSVSPQEREAGSQPGARPPPGGGRCYVCGRPVGAHSLRIHERQCLRRWRTENDALPPRMRAPEPRRSPDKQQAAAEPETVTVTETTEGAAAAVAAGGGNETDQQEQQEEARPRTGSGRRPPLFPCYLCGRLFTVHSIYIHEPQCLEAWRRQNDSLPPSQRRPQPLKPDVKFTRDGRVDLDAVSEANWKSHLSQLVPCKFCSRTFNPDRVQVHEKSCKG